MACGDDVGVDTYGTPSFEDDVPLARDAIFQIASLTKPITAAATLSLVEEGVLRLEDPIDDLIPELADRRVLRSLDGALDDTVPAARPITLEDLLSYRLGSGSVMAPADAYPIQWAEAALGLPSIGGPPWPRVTHDVDGWIGALGSLPLLCQPGEQWFPDAGGWLVSIIDDFWAFVSMVVAGGTGRGKRILSPAMLPLMTTDRLTPSQREEAAPFLGEYGGWGLGLAVPRSGSSNRSIPCGIGWEGGTGPAWRSNPQSGVTGIVFSQREATSPAPPRVIEDFWAGINAATATT